jgi:ABC-type amino acid transport substrate-binding protein
MKYNGNYSEKMDAAWQVWMRENPQLSDQFIKTIYKLWQDGAIQLQFKFFTLS